MFHRAPSVRGLGWVCFVLSMLGVAVAVSAEVGTTCVPVDERTRSCFPAAAARPYPTADAAAGCGDFTSDGVVSASDALGILSTAVGVAQCLPCVCDLDISGSVTATDALIALNFSVGLIVELTCQTDGNPVAWDGGGDGVSWSDPMNWDLETRTPNLCDDVTIAAGTIVTVLQETLDNGASRVTSSFPIDVQSGSLTVRSTLESTALVRMTGGRLVGAEVSAPAVEFLAGAGTLDGVTLNAPVAMDDSDSVQVINGLVLNDTVTFANGQIEFGSDQTLSGTGELVFTNGGSIRTPDNSVLTIAPDIVIRGGSGNIGADGASNAIVNRGTIASDEPGQIFIEGRMGWTNEGTISASNGGSLRLGPTLSNTGTISVAGGGTLGLEGAWQNDGTMTMVDSTVTLGGTFSLASLGDFQRSGGSVRITGIFDNVSGLLLDAATGSWELAGGTVVGGTIATSEGATLIPTGSQGVLDSVTIDSPLAVPSGTAFLVSNGVTLNATLTVEPGGTVGFNGGDNVIKGSAEIVFPGPGGPAYLFPRDSCALTIGAGITVHGSGGYIGSDSSSASVTVEGTVDSDAGGQIQLRSLAAVGSNAGTMRASNGTLNMISAWSSSGRIELKENGVLQADNDLELSGSSVLQVEIGGTDSFGKVAVASQATLAGVLEISLAGGFEPNLGDRFVVMTHGGRSGAFSSVTGASIGNGKQFQVSYEAAQLALEVVAE